MEEGGMKRMMKANLVAALLALVLAACAQGPQAERQAAEREATQARMTDGKALFEEKCRTVAGEKIYRKVENVEGVLLLKVRSDRGDVELANRDWPGAAFARESRGDGYISTFLGSEYASNAAGKDDPITPSNRGYIANPGGSRGLPGYRWVEVIDAKEDKRYRYTGSVTSGGAKRHQCDRCSDRVGEGPQVRPEHLRTGRSTRFSPHPRRRHGTPSPTKTTSSPRNATSGWPAAPSRLSTCKRRKCWAR
jgi:hypothetical protein